MHTMHCYYTIHMITSSIGIYTYNGAVYSVHMWLLWRQIQFHRQIIYEHTFFVRRKRWEKIRVRWYNAKCGTFIALTLQTKSNYDSRQQKRKFRFKLYTNPLNGHNGSLFHPQCSLFLRRKKRSTPASQFILIDTDNNKCYAICHDVLIGKWAVMCGVFWQPSDFI